MEDTFNVLCENSGTLLDGRIATVREHPDYPNHYLMVKREFRGLMIEKKFCTVLKEPKESWNKEEVKHILFLYYNHCMDEYNGYASEEAMDEIIDKHL